MVVESRFIKVRITPVLSTARNLRAVDTSGAAKKVSGDRKVASELVFFDQGRRAVLRGLFDQRRLSWRRYHVLLRSRQRGILMEGRMSLKWSDLFKIVESR